MRLSISTKCAVMKRRFNSLLLVIMDSGLRLRPAPE
jgi:hypothetical protein